MDFGYHSLSGMYYLPFSRLEITDCYFAVSGFLNKLPSISRDCYSVMLGELSMQNKRNWAIGQKWQKIEMIHVYRHKLQSTSKVLGIPGSDSTKMR